MHFGGGSSRPRGALLKRMGLTQLWCILQSGITAKRALGKARRALGKARQAAAQSLCLHSKGGIKKGDSILMGIGMDSFYWDKFYLLQTLFRLGPQGPKGL